MAAERDRRAVAAWRKSSASADSHACVEIARREPFVLVRDSVDKSGPVVELTSAQWRGLLDRIRSGELGRG